MREAILEKLYNKIFVEKLIRYTEIHDMKQDDALEMFVRFNSGGKALRKSEITMSILEAYWLTAKTEFGKVLADSIPASAPILSSVPLSCSMAMLLSPILASR